MNLNKLKEVLSIQSYSGQEGRMIRYIKKQVKKMGLEVVEDKMNNLYITRGIADKYPCVVAHSDTVHKIEEDKTVVRVGDNLVAFNQYTMEQIGVGGDDQCGIFLALECLKHFDIIKVAIFSSEEVGCEGSYQADTSFFKDVMFVLQGDRKGNSDFVVEASGTQLSNEKFQEAVLPALYNHGYNFAHGMMTDVMALREIGIECSMANVSCGYYNPHCKDEYVNIPDVENTLSLFKEIISTLNDDFDFVGDIKKPYSYYDWDKQPTEELCIDCCALPVKHSHLCEECLKWYEPTEVLPYKEDDFEEFIQLCNKKK